MKRGLLFVSAGLVLLAVSARSAQAHCQIPCGIYDDPMRFTMMLEHVTTIEKSMNEIHRLSEETPLNHNQIVRWVMNKEDHAQQLSEIVTFYFMAQRIKPADPADRAASAKYVREITLLHQIMVQAMKAKQTADLTHCENLRTLIGKFKASYLGEQSAADTDAAAGSNAAGHAHSHAGGAAHSH